MATRVEPDETRVLVFALFGGDAEITQRILSSVGIASTVCVGIDALCAEIREGAGAVVLAEEALVPDAVERLTDVLAEQEPWSDLPIVVSATERTGARENMRALAMLGERANVAIVERPIRVRTMISAVKNALRARARQYATRSMIDERAELLRREKEAREQAEAISQGKDEFLATVSHELRTPLNAMLGWARMLTTGRLDAVKSRRALEAIERNAVAQSQLVNDLLDVSRIISGKLRLDVGEMDLRRVVEAATESVRPAMEAKEIHFTSIADPAACSVLGDPNRLQQVIWNLLSNAIKFSPRGGAVRLSLARVDAHVALTVTDTGQGIDAAFIPSLFQRFRQAESGATRSQGGLGLGLAICRHLVELHGGTIEAFSEGLGKGSTFIVELPMLPARPVPVIAPRPVQHSSDRPYTFERPPELAGLSVLVVDDQADSRELLASVIADCSATPREASSALEALRIVESERPDIIVSDVGMPGEDGYSFIRRVRQLPPEKGGRTPAAALTAYARAEDRQQAMKAGFEMHLPKPVDLVELMQVLATLARLGRATS